MDCSVCKPSLYYENTGSITDAITLTSDAPVPVQESNVSTLVPVPVSKHRKNVDFNVCELVDAIMISIHAKLLPCIISVNTAENIREVCQGWLDSQNVPSCIRLNAFTDLPKYMSDLTSKSACISKRIIAFNELIVSTTTASVSASGFKFTDIVCVYVSGKKNAHEKIHTLNSGLDIKQQKGDIYIEYTTGEIVGWSCKQSSHATKSNYSVQKILGPVISRDLKRIKTQFLVENGFPTFSKEQRDAVNQLFYPNKKNNPYWDAVRYAITHNKSDVIDELVKGLTGYTVPYTLYEFDGSSFNCLNATNNNGESSSSSSTVTFEEYAEYYKMKNGEERSAAKLFYQLCIAQKKYRVEIRWKGNIHAASPQFQIHDDHCAIHDIESDADVDASASASADISSQ